MRSRRRSRACRVALRIAAAVTAAVCAALPLAARGFVDPLDAPARPSPLAAHALLNDVAVAGKRLVAVGERGHVVFSDDAGASWSQAAVPVSTDLTAVHFPTAARGWVVGHSGVILSTTDGGRTWTKQLDRRLLAAAIASRCDPGACDSRPELREQIALLAADASDASFLDVWFADEQTGFAVGAFNLVVRTRDGGRTWEPWVDRSENPRGLHLYAIACAGGEVLAAGEQGLLLALDRSRERFRALPVAHGGTFFGIAGDEASVVAVGLRGRVVRSGDGGRSWAEVETGLDDSLTAGATTARGELVVVSQSGDVLVSTDGGESFRRVPVARRLPAAGVAAAAPDAVVIVGPAGARVEVLR